MEEEHCYGVELMFVLRARRCGHNCLELLSVEQRTERCSQRWDVDGARTTVGAHLLRVEIISQVRNGRQKWDDRSSECRRRRMHCASKQNSRRCTLPETSVRLLHTKHRPDTLTRLTAERRQTQHHTTFALSRGMTCFGHSQYRMIEVECCMQFMEGTCSSRSVCRGPLCIASSS
jgi:hypothetical protein